MRSRTQTSSRFARQLVQRQNRADGALTSRLSDEMVRKFVWHVFSIASNLAVIRRGYAKLLGIAGPQWLIIMAIEYLDGGIGVPVGMVSAHLHVKSTFVTAETKRLEQLGLVSRYPSPHDGRVVLMSLTEKARTRIKEFSGTRRDANDLIFRDMTANDLASLVSKLAYLQTGVESAATVVRALTLK